MKKIDKLTSMMSKLTAQGNKQDKQFKCKIYQGKKRGQTKITRTKVITRPEIDLTVVVEECHLEVEVGMNRFIEEDCSKLTVT